MIRAFARVKNVTSPPKVRLMGETWAEVTSKLDIEAMTQKASPAHRWALMGTTGIVAYGFGSDHQTARWYVQEELS